MRKDITMIILSVVFSVPGIACLADPIIPPTPTTTNEGSLREITVQQKEQAEISERVNKQKKNEIRKNNSKKGKETIKEMDKPDTETNGLNSNVGENKAERKL